MDANNLICRQKFPPLPSPSWGGVRGGGARDLSDWRWPDDGTSSSRMADEDAGTPGARACDGGARSFSYCVR